MTIAPLLTTITRAIVETDRQTVAVGSTASIVGLNKLKIDAGLASEEVVDVLAVGVGTITAAFAKTHLAGASVSADRTVAQITFDLVPGLSAYRVSVKDEFGFDNGTPPRRSLRLTPEPPPEVRLLRDTFFLGGDQEVDLEGLPVVLGAPFRVPYRCDAPYGMSQARVLYRVLKKHVSGNDPVEDEKWIPLPLTEIPEDPNPRLRNTIGRLAGLIQDLNKLRVQASAADAKGGPELAELQDQLLDRAEKIKTEIRPQIERLSNREEIEKNLLNEASQHMRKAAPYLNAGKFADAVAEQQEAAAKLTEVHDQLTWSLRVFDQKTGLFACTPFDEQIPFHAAPSVNPDQFLGRTLGGGRAFVSTKGILDSKGKVQLKSGDQIEFCVEVFAMPRQKEATPSGRSETRVTTVVDSSELANWFQNLNSEAARVRALELQQKGIFDRK
jgi:hypothetical protein